MVDIVYSKSLSHNHEHQKRDECLIRVGCEEALPNTMSPLIQRVSVSIGVATVIPDGVVHGANLIEALNRALYTIEAARP